jgi:hypothetical protein
MAYLTSCENVDMSGTIFAKVVPSPGGEEHLVVVGVRGVAEVGPSAE